MRDDVRELAMTLTCPNCQTPGHRMTDCKQLIEKSDKSVMWRMAKGNGAHTIILTTIQARTGISSCQSPQVSI